MTPAGAPRPGGGWFARLQRYGLVGAVATACHYAVLVVSVEAFGLAAWLASGLGAAVGAQVAYFGNRRYTFSTPRHDGRAWLRFQLTALIGALAGMGIVAGVVALGAHYLVGQVLATGTALLLTYEINRRWTFG